jgi:[protein-PII] uridylyltransferase
MEWIVLPDPHAPDLTATDIQREIKRAFGDESQLAEKIQSRINAYASLPTIPVPAPIVETFLDAATDATIIEVRSHDRPALLFSIGDAIRRCNIDIRAAIVTTLGAEAIDADLEELTLPYRFDVRALAAINYAPLLEHN